MTAITSHPADSAGPASFEAVQPRASHGAPSTARRFRDHEGGATAIEYALMAMFFSVTVIGGSSSVRNALQTAFTTVSSAVLAASNG